MAATSGPSSHPGDASVCRQYLDRLLSARGASASGRDCGNGGAAWPAAVVAAADAGQAAAARALMDATHAAAWTSSDAATRRAACRLARAALAGDDTALAAAAAAVAVPGALGALEGGASETGVLDVLAACASALEGGDDGLKQDDCVRAALGRVAARAATAAAVPPEAVFADVGGDPKAAVDCDTVDAQAWRRRAAACARVAAAAVAAAARPGDLGRAAAVRAPKPPPAEPPPRVELAEDLWNVMGRLADAGPRSAAKGLVIEVLGGDESGGRDDGDDSGGSGGSPEGRAPTQAEIATSAIDVTAAKAAATSVADAAVAVLLLCALHTADADLDGAWAAGPAAEAAQAALDTLAGVVEADDGDGGQGGELVAVAGGEPEATTADSLPAATVAARLLPACAATLASVIIQEHWRSLDDAVMEPYAGPGVYERTLAARRAAWLVRALPAVRLRAAADALLPTLLAAADDPAPAVQRSGLRALHRLAADCPPALLAADRGLLAGAALRALTGCDARAWPAAAPAALALVLALDAGAAATGIPTPPPAACLQVADAFLAEGERHAHQVDWARIWTTAAPPWVAALGLSVVGLYARLMPLVLRWLAAPDGGVRVGAARTLAAALRVGWPRVSAHAAHVWAHVAAARGREGVGEDEAAALADVVRVLWAAGGEGLRDLARADDSVGGRLLLAGVGEGRVGGDGGSG